MKTKIINPRVSIIILNWNGLKDTIRCLESLKKIIYQNYEVIVVDNNSIGNDAEVLEKKYNNYIKLIKNKKNLGCAEGNNVPIRQILKKEKSKYILLLDNDTIVDINFLTELIGIAKRNEKISIFQPKMLQMTNPKIINSTGHVFGFGYSRIIDRGKNEMDKGQYDNKLDIIGACAGACMYKREMLENIGLFDKNLFTCYEDAELSWRAYKQGWKGRFVPSAIVYHRGGGTVGKDKNKKRVMTNLCLRNMIITVEKHGTTYQKFLFIIFLIYKTVIFGVEKLIGKNNLELKVYINAFKEARKLKKSNK